jgi:hypothetical protein
MSNKKSNTRQHFVSRFYLKEWSDADEKTWMYPVNGAAPIHISIDEIAVERGLYSHPAADKVPPLKTEKFLGERIESLYADKWPEIIDRAEDIETRKNIARFVALMVLRHPQEKENIRTVNKAFREAVSGHSPDEEVEFVIGGKSIIIRVGEVLKSASDDQDTIQSQFLRDMPHVVVHSAEVLVKRRWGIVCSDSPAFVTSDCPVVLCRGMSTKTNFGFGTPGTNILFPISPTRLLAIDDRWDYEFAHYKLTKPDIYNRIIARGAARFVYAHNENADLAAKISEWRSTLRRD